MVKFLYLKQKSQKAIFIIALKHPYSKVVRCWRRWRCSGRCGRSASSAWAAARRWCAARRSRAGAPCGPPCRCTSTPAPSARATWTRSWRTTRCPPPSRPSSRACASPCRPPRTPTLREPPVRLHVAIAIETRDVSILWLTLLGER